MRYFVMGCAVAALVALSAKSEARLPLNSKAPTAMPVVSLVRSEVGIATWYGQESQGTTASGEVYDMEQLTAAHRTLPLGSKVRVTNLRNSRSVVLRVNDRGPNVAGRLIDVSRAAARSLGFLGEGLTPVRITVLQYPRHYLAQPVAGQTLAACARFVE